MIHIKLLSVNMHSNCGNLATLRHCYCTKGEMTLTVMLRSYQKGAVFDVYTFFITCNQLLESEEEQPRF